MKPTRLLYTVVWLFLAARLGQSIKCFSCGFSEPNETNSSSSCETNSKIKDCSLHPEFGEHYDSCFSQVVVVGGKPKIQIKECAMFFGCKELEGVLCEGNSVDDSENSSQSCRVECCKGDYCNENLASEAYAFSGGNFMLSSTAITTVLLSSSFAVFYELVVFTS
ncbi:uncharacterized protein LOC144628910 [Oculina patagonica]